MVIGREFEIVPVLPFAVATTLPSTVSVRPLGVRVHTTRCQAPFEITPDSTALRRNAPDELTPRNTQFRRPLGFSSLK